MRLQRFNEKKAELNIQNVDQFILNLKDILSRESEIVSFYNSGIKEIKYIINTFEITKGNLPTVIKSHKLTKYEIDFIDNWHNLSKSISYFETKIDELFDFKLEMTWSDIDKFELHINHIDKKGSNLSITPTELIDLSQEIKSFSVDINVPNLPIAFYSGNIILIL